MATLLKIRGLNRGSAKGDLTSRGFRVRHGVIKNSVTGGTSVKASLAVGTTTNGIKYTAVPGGASGNNIKIVQSAAGTAAITVSAEASTGNPVITIVPQTGETLNALAARVNADADASQYISAAGGAAGDGTGSGTTPATATSTALASGADGTGTAERFYVNVSSRGTVVVDVDDTNTQQSLRRSSGRFLPLGQP
jgi:hypothetical protein